MMNRSALRARPLEGLTDRAVALTKALNSNGFDHR